MCLVDLKKSLKREIMKCNYKTGTDLEQQNLELIRK